MTRQPLLSTCVYSLFLFAACGTAAPIKVSPIPSSPMPVDGVARAGEMPLQPAVAATEPATFATQREWSGEPISRSRVVDTSDHSGFRAGDWDVMISGSGNNDNHWDSGAGALTASVGYLFTDVLELSGRQSQSMANSQGSGTMWSGASQIALDVYFLPGPVKPFVGANVGRVYGEGVDDTYTAAPEAGIKWFLKRDAYLLAMVEYELDFDHVRDMDDGWKDATFLYTVGFGLRF